MPWTPRLCREARKKERLEGEVKQLKGALEARQADIKTKSATAQQSEEQVTSGFHMPCCLLLMTKHIKDQHD